MVCIDIFRKKIQVVPMKTNDAVTVYNALMERLKVLRTAFDDLQRRRGSIE